MKAQVRLCLYVLCCVPLAQSLHVIPGVLSVNASSKEKPVSAVRFELDKLKLHRNVLLPNATLPYATSLSAREAFCSHCWGVDSIGRVQDLQGGCVTNPVEPQQCIKNGHVCSASSSPNYVPCTSQDGNIRVDAAEPRVAVLISGLQDRLLIDTKIKSIVRPCRDAGIEVDFYISLVKSGTNSVLWSPVQGGVASPEAAALDFERVLREAIQGSGARLAHYSVLAGQEDVESDFPKHATLQQQRRLSDYSPFVSETGKNVLRRFQSIEHLYKASKENGRYSGVLVTRDDDYWLGDLPIKNFSWIASPAVSNYVATKNCMTWGGLNDKTFFYGEVAAEKVLSNLYTNFWVESPFLEQATNAEFFWLRFIEALGVQSRPVPFELLPTADSVYVKTESGIAGICQKSEYLCPFVPNAAITPPTLCK